MPLDFDASLRAIRDSAFAPYVDDLAAALEVNFLTSPHGNEQKWDDALARLPAISTGHQDFEGPVIRIGRADELDRSPSDLAEQLRAFMPWRKGPWSLFGVDIDTEWRSDLKWARLSPHISPLEDRTILDIGCGNGYYLLRMLGMGARFALGVDPTLLFLYQFAAARRFTHQLPAQILPLRDEHLPVFGCADTVFSLGVLYHRRTPGAHLAQLSGFLRPGGELVLETLVIPGEEIDVLVPEDRYAMMRNVWYLPTIRALERELEATGFIDIRTVDVTRTTTEEQRSTEWMAFQSLPDFLDPDNPTLTVEGLPAPMRAIVIANRPG